MKLWPFLGLKIPFCGPLDFTVICLSFSGPAFLPEWLFVLVFFFLLKPKPFVCLFVVFRQVFSVIAQISTKDLVTFICGHQGIRLSLPYAHSTHLWRSGDNMPELFLSFHHVGPGGMKLR